ncbi:hypothetical protein [Kitasatospora sp. MY 5-36]|uniref:hypothetical protein n=1 Tax=Kitasatospora sp. MY 5-36 TaxID=1678027 RepID=UPI00131D5BDA|nr:hypothetical protein [Kitasatospora sp. MY 5-36]
MITALQRQDEEELATIASDQFSYVLPESPVLAELPMGDFDDFRSAEAVIVVTDQSADGLTLTGLATWNRHSLGVHWQFEVEEDQVSVLHVTAAQLPEATRKEAEEALRMLLDEVGFATFGSTRDGTGRTHPQGTLRRTSMGHGHYVLSEWTVGGAGRIGWINKDEKLPDPHVYRSLRSPESGEHDCRSTYAKVTSHLDLTLGWDDDSYQKATASFHAAPYRWDAVTWLTENLDLVDRAKPRISGTLTLTGPDGAVVSTEEITVKGDKQPFPLAFTREFALADRPVGRYTLTFTDAVKSGGYSPSGGTTVELKDHAITFTVGA